MVVPFAQGDMTLGRWQEICFLCFDNRPRQRTLVAQCKRTGSGHNALRRYSDDRTTTLNEERTLKPKLQVALDFVDLPRALKVAEEAVEGGVDWLEAGTPLIKSEGLQAVRELRTRWPRHTVIADMKTMDAGRAEVEYAAKAGANIVGVLGRASDATIRECVEAGRNYGADIMVDMIQVDDPVSRAMQVEEMGASYIGIHVAIDEQMEGRTPFETLRQVANEVSIPVSVAGGINSETAAEAAKAGASIIVVGGAIIKASDAAEATRQIKRAVSDLVSVKSKYFVRAKEDGMRATLERVSAANVSDALHRTGDLPGIIARSPGANVVGPAGRLLECLFQKGGLSSLFLVQIHVSRTHGKSVLFTHHWTNHYLDTSIQVRGHAAEYKCLLSVLLPEVRQVRMADVE